VLESKVLRIGLLVMEKIPQVRINVSLKTQILQIKKARIALFLKDFLSVLEFSRILPQALNSKK
jgi:hypothetical protein